jgi:hypothetical protein
MLKALRFFFDVLRLTLFVFVLLQAGSYSYLSYKLKNQTKNTRNMLRTKDDNNHDINRNLSLVDVLKSISDDKSLSIFGLIADVNSNGEITLKKLGLSNKQHHSRISQMMATGLIERQNGRYYLTSFGKVIV